MTLDTSVYYEPWDPACREQLWERYHQLLEQAPIYQTPSGTWIVSRYEDVQRLAVQSDALSSRPNQEEGFGFPPRTDLFNDEELGRLAAIMLEMPLDMGELAESQIMVAADEPIHGRMRRIVNRGFTPRRVALLEDICDAITDDCLSGLDQKETFEVIGDIGAPLPVRMITELLGIDPARQQDVVRWSDEVITMTQIAERLSPDSVFRLVEILREFSSYLVPLIEERRRKPGADLLSALVSAQEAETLTPTETVLFALLLMIAGNETSRNLIGNAVVSLIRNPDQLDLLVQQPDLLGGAIEETLRFESPLQFSFRRTVEPIAVQGTTIEPGELMILLWGAANRDPRQYEDPDRFDITRTGSHLAFGFGSHFCVGAHLARLEAKCALRELVPQLATFALDEQGLTRLPSLVTHGFARIPLHRLADTLSQ